MVCFSVVCLNVCCCVEVEEGLDLNKLTSWLDGMKETTVAVHVPRFRVEDSFSVKEKLQAMGLTDLFSSERASLPGDRHFFTHYPSSSTCPRAQESHLIIDIS